VRDSRKAAWTLSVPAVADSLRTAIELRTALGRIARLIDGLGAYAEAIRPAPTSTSILLTAQRRMGENSFEVTRVLLGEDWLEYGTEHLPPRSDQAVHEAYTSRREQDYGRLTRVLAAAWSTPAPVDILSWRDAVEDAARTDASLRGVVENFRRVAAARPAFAVLGDYNSGKSSLIRRILVDDGRPHAAFDIRASPATAAAARYEFPRFDLVDTPGLQSGDDEHDTAAFEAIAEAALVFVVLQVNFLIGNTSLLEQLARGSERIAAKGARMMFLVNRCDEVGVDPLGAPGAFLNWQDRKREELRAAFAARSVEVGLDRIHCLSGDPFGLVGDDATAESGHFDENRLWDGVAALTSTLSALSGEQLSAAASSAAFDAAVTELRRHRHTLERQQIDDQKELDRAEPLIGVLQAALSDADVLGGSLREDARRMVDRHAVAAKSAVAQLGRKDGEKLQELVDSWWKVPQFEDDLKRHLADAARKLDEWHNDHISTIGREMRAAELRVAPEFAAEFQARGSSWHEELTEGAGQVTGHVASLAKALGSRDAVYTIGKQLGHKFKPWEAVKGGAKVAKVGAVLGVVAAAVDGVTMANDLRKAGDHKQQQEAALREIDKSAAGILDQIVDGEQGDGPVRHLGQWVRELEALLDEHLALASSVRERRDSASARAQVITALVTAAEELTGSAGERE
jgi:50S ribosome-binding GTPase